MTKTLDAATFDEIFEGMTVTLMAARPLCRELALLRAVLPPSAPSDWPPRPVLLDEVLDLSARLSAMLPPTPPDDYAALRQRLSPLPRLECALAKNLAADTWQMLRSAPVQTRLWLVPSVWPLRMGMLLQGQTFPAQIHYWGTWRPH